MTVGRSDALFITTNAAAVTAANNATINTTVVLLLALSGDTNCARLVSRASFGSGCCLLIRPPGDFGFWIFDFGLRIQIFTFGLQFRFSQSKIQNPKSKIPLIISQ